MQVNEELSATTEPGKVFRWHERDWFIGSLTAFNVTIAIINLAAVLYGVHAIREEFVHREEIDRPLAAATFEEIQAASEARERERLVTDATLVDLRASLVARLWDRLRDENSRLSTKIDAINALVELGVDIDGSDFSCAGLYPNGSRFGDECRANLWQYSRLELGGSEQRIFAGIDLSEAELQGANLQNITCLNCSFRGAKMIGVLLDGSQLVDSNFERATLGSILQSQATITRPFLSAAFITFPPDERTGIVNGWYLRGAPPNLVALVDPSSVDSVGDELSPSDYGFQRCRYWPGRPRPHVLDASGPCGSALDENPNLDFIRNSYLRRTVRAPTMPNPSARPRGLSGFN